MRIETCRQREIYISSKTEGNTTSTLAGRSIESIKENFIDVEELPWKTILERPGETAWNIVTVSPGI